MIDMFCSLLTSKKLFRLNFSKEFLEKLSLRMKEYKIGPKEYVYKQGDNNSCRIYFIQKGKSNYFIKKIK